MPATCYTKALREPVYFLWEARKGNRVRCAKFRSRAATGLKFGTRALCYDHAIPFRLLQNELLLLNPVTRNSVARVLNRFDTAVLITPEENERLNKAGYKDKMPDGWDGSDPLARYRAVGLELVENEASQP
jgi:hypothetical protein